MRNSDLIYSIAQNMIDKHYDDELEDDDCEEDENFHSMFEVSRNEDFWDYTKPPRREIMRHSLAALILLGITATSIIIALLAILPVSITFLLVGILVNAVFYTDRLRAYSRNVVMVSIFGSSLLLTAVCLASTAVILLFRMFSS